MPVDKDATSRGMSKYGPLKAHHPMKKMGSMKKDGLPKHGQPFHAYGKPPMNKLGYKE